MVKIAIFKQHFKEVFSLESTNEKKFIIILGLLATLLTLLPHLLVFIKFGSLIWIADYDELSTYLPAFARTFHENSISIVSPMSFESAKSAYYPWVLFYPPLFLSKFFTGSYELSPFFWRMFTGISLPLSFYFLLKRFINDSFFCFLGSIFFLFSPAFL